MNREIKFRAWCENEKGEKAMLSDMAFLQSNGIISTPVFHHSSNFYIIRKAIMMQYTGLKDKNGKEIYEKDIIMFLDGIISSTENGVDCDETLSTGLVTWDKNELRYTVSSRESVDLEDLWADPKEIEVIGNIYENVELLKNGQ